MYTVSTPTLEGKVAETRYSDAGSALLHVFGTVAQSYLQALLDGRTVTYGCVGKVYMIKPVVI